MSVQTPAPRPLGVSDVEAVELCRQWMVYLGAADSVVASGDARQICDLYSRHYLAWVDNRQQNLDAAFVERAARLCENDGRRGLVFVPGGVFPDAQDTAEALGVALLRFDPYGADLDGANPLGRSVRSLGLAFA
ncbi:hypothetical protein [Leifsonia sp. NPDC077715]|uniref:hypothetical protein n=1 Tax=Leifsonia sp. NPDC077715 TaxID=3155539 RepID=UPI003448FB2B